ncbi:MAG: EAL domain-containing protein [Gammaproteobacteria bacterium]|nr:EAL domain-containing protein [Gammaproteobacteria bacterium]
MSSTSKLTPEQMALVIDAADLAVWDWQVQSGQLFFNRRWAELLGYRHEELNPISYETWEGLVHPNDLKKAKWSLEQHFKGLASSYEIEFRMKTKQGKYHWVLAIGKTIEFDEDQKPVRMLGVHIDINDRKSQKTDLDRKTKLLEESQRIAKVGGWELDIPSGELFWTNETYRIHDTSPDEFYPTVDAGVGYFLPDSKAQIINALERAIEKGEGYDLELETYTTKGRKIDVRTNGIVLFENGKPRKLLGTFQDITEQKIVQKRLEKTNRELENLNHTLKKSAHYDPLTGLPNRALLEDRMEQNIASCKRRNQYLAVVFIDLDGFKEINDTYGHNIGDELLCHIASKIQGCLRKSDTVARFGGDEFVVLINELNSVDDSKSVLEKIHKAVSESASIQYKDIRITASIGVTTYPRDSSNYAHLIRHADQAMYIAKNSGKNSIHIFDVEKDSASRFHIEELETIRQALLNNEFVLFFQPKIDLSSNLVIGAEALIRWLHPTEGLLPPIKFLPIIEGDLLTIEVGEWVIRQALEQLSNWAQQGINLPISVNLDSLHLQNPNFIERLKLLISEFPNFKAGSLEFEIVETSAVNEIERAADVITACRDLGVGFSIDDFGTGYSSLTYLKRLPTDILKIDRSFVRDMLSDSDDKAIVEGIIQLAKTFKKQVIAEGVETIEHGKQLLNMGCNLAQGFGISRPVPIIEFNEWFENWKKDNDWKSLSQK